MGVNTVIFSAVGSGSAETLTVAGNTSLAASTALDLEILSAASFDRLLVTAGAGPGTERGGAILNLAVGYSPTIGSSFSIIDMQGTAFLAGSQCLRLPDKTTFFSNHEFVSGGTTLRINYDVAPRGGVTLTVVPEPSCLVLLGIGAAALGGWRRRRSGSAGEDTGIPERRDASALCSSRVSAPKVADVIVRNASR